MTNLLAKVHFRGQFFAPQLHGMFVAAFNRQEVNAQCED
jgi:hypothetical protein